MPQRCSSEFGRDRGDRVHGDRLKRIAATPTEYDDRTTPDGKTSSVHWLRFQFTKDQITRFKSERVVIGIGHKHYGHMAVLSEEARNALAQDFA